MKIAGWMRVLLAVPAVLALVSGMLSGLARLGWPMPAQFAALVPVHAALMVGGFFGTLIGLERAVAVSANTARPWPFLAPLLSGVATLALIAGATQTLAATLMSAAALIMSAACIHVWRKQKVAHLAVLALAALAWFAGNLVWLATESVLLAVALWAGFLVLTIAGERLELSRFVPTPQRARRVFACIVALLLAGAVIAIVHQAGLRLFAFALLALAVWLLRHDIARRTIRSAGLTRYMAVCLLSGYLWLGIAAALGLAGAFMPGHALRDAALHALLLGFVLAMVFGHAPVILPALTRLGFRWHRGFYLPLLALHITVALRLISGMLASFSLRQHAGLGNALVILMFMGFVVVSVRRGVTTRSTR